MSSRQLAGARGAAKALSGQSVLCLFPWQIGPEAQHGFLELPGKPLHEEHKGQEHPGDDVVEAFSGLRM